MKNRIGLLAALLIVWLQACKSAQTLTDSTPTDDWPTEVTTPDGNVYIPLEEEEEAVPEWVSKKSEYRPEKTKFFQLNHTKIEAAFDWEKQHLLGKATLSLQPYFYPQTAVKLDAKGFDIHRVGLITGKDTSDLKYEYNGLMLIIDLKKEYSRKENLQLFIDYTAKPNELESTGSAAITSDKGLYFINPLGKDAHKPRQIWTQGETEASSCWFPTFDAPNAKTTEELLLTVDTAFVTVANGKLLSSTINDNGTRTDHWKQEKPHAPYLFAFAIGEFAKVTDTWEGKEVSYYVEPKYEKYARDIFGRTPQMIEFFSEKFDYPYPWEKYSQVVVRDFVSGAMENTSVSIFMEQLQVDDRYFQDDSWDGIISHELIHHWFGNLVTAESWANLPLNESFANYGEYLWLEHYHGREEADLLWLEERDNYLYEAETKQEPMIRYQYADKEEMFDSHSYSKGCLLLHLLRKQIGDDAFFASLQLYLKRNAFKAAEIHQLRLAFEEVTGMDLNWFFNQWFMEAGHPTFFVKESYEEGKVKLTFLQEQDPKYTPIYRFPIDVDIWVNGKKTRHQVLVNQATQSFEFEASQQPDLVLFDPEHLIPGVVDYLRTTEAFIYQYYHAESVLHRLTALEELQSDLADATILPVFKDALKADFWKLRQVAAEAFAQYNGADKDTILQQLKDLVINDPKSLVRASALAAVTSMEGDLHLIAQALTDSSYTVLATALYAYVNAGGENTLQTIAKYESLESTTVQMTIADFYSNYGVAGKYSWFAQGIGQFGGQKQQMLINYLGQYLMKQPPVSQVAGIALLDGLARNAPNYQTRMLAFRSLMLLDTTEGVEERLKAIKDQETDPKVIAFYQNLGVY